MIKKLFRKYFELVFWLGGLLALALSNPTAAAHFSLCPLKAMGLTWCPGCGLGHSLSFLFHGDIAGRLGYSYIFLVGGPVGWNYNAKRGDPRRES